jgi:ParB/RepB/Spo0J family partition protein
MIRSLSKDIKWIAVSQLLENDLTLFSLNYDSPALNASIKALGILTPLVLLAKQGDKYQIACGHRRTEVAKVLGLETIPAWIISQDSTEADLLHLNLIENNRVYDDIERGRIISKLMDSMISENSVIKEYMPRIGLEKSKNLFDQYLQSAKLDDGLQKVFYELKVPIRVYGTCFRWKLSCQIALKNILETIRPGVNKTQFLVNAIDEIAHKETLEPKDIIFERPITEFLELGGNAGAVFDKIQDYLFKRRFPELAKLKKDVLLARDKLNLCSQIKIKTSESFEDSGIRLEIKFSTQEEIIKYSENLADAAKSREMKELIKIFKSI